LSEVNEGFRKRRRGEESGKTGYLGECLVQLELATNDIKSFRIPEGVTGEYDLITPSGIRIEVKTSRPSKEPSGMENRLWWHFRNYGARGRRKVPRRCDFYVLVCLPRDTKTYEPEGYFVIPANKLRHLKSPEKELTSIAVVPEDWTGAKGSRWHDYRDRWDLITHPPPQS